MSDFEPVESRNTRASAPTLRVSPDSNSSYLSAGAIRRYFEGVDRVSFMVDRDRSLLAIVPDDGQHSYSLSGETKAGAQVAITQALREVDVERDDLDDAYTLPVEEDDDTGHAVVDLTEVVEATTDDAHCPECGERYAEAGIGAHLRTHDDAPSPQELLEDVDPNDVGEPIPEGDDSWREQSERGSGEA